MQRIIWPRIFFPLGESANGVFLSKSIMANNDGQMSFFFHHRWVLRISEFFLHSQNLANTTLGEFGSQFINSDFSESSFHFRHLVPVTDLFLEE